MTLEPLRSGARPRSIRGRPKICHSVPTLQSSIFKEGSNPLDTMTLFAQYMAMSYMSSPTLDRELKKGSAELLILSLVEARPRHGYEISKLIEQRSDGAVRFHVASLYPLLYRLEKRGWVEGRWVEKAGQRRRRYYRLTAEGKEVLASQRKGWQVFAAAINRIAGVEHA